MSLGGFQSGFQTRVVSRLQAKFPQFLICNHACEEVIQLVSNVSGEVEFELCVIEAEKMARVLLEAVRGARGIDPVDTKEI